MSQVSPTYRVLVTDRAWPDLSVEREIVEPLGLELVEAPPAADEATLCRLAEDVDVIATCWAKVTAPVIRAAPRLRGIARFGIGLDNICLQTATERKIPIAYVPDYCVEEVADHTMALLLACARKIAFYHSRTKQGEYKLAAGGTMHRLRGSVLGLVGLGRIGTAVATRAKAFGLEIQATTRSGKSIGESRGDDLRMVSLDQLLKTSDFVSLHCPLSPATKHLIGAAELALMKPSAFLINTSRGGLVDSSALYDALLNKRLLGAALDVFDPEPPDLKAPLYRHEAVIATPHAAFLSAESLIDLRRRTMEEVLRLLRGERPLNLANPAIIAE